MHVYCLSAAAVVLRLFICIVPVCCGFLGISQSEKLKTLQQSFQIDKKTEPQCSGKESIRLRKLGGFSPFVKALLKASIIIAIFCGCAVLRCYMPHFTAGRAQMCAAVCLRVCTRLLPRYMQWFHIVELYIHKSCTVHTVIPQPKQFQLCITTTIQCCSVSEQVLGSLAKLPKMCCHCCVRSQDFTYYAFWHPTAR